QARITEAQAEAERKRGGAEADVLLQKLAAEAKGLTDKFQALSSLDDGARAHEEFRMQLEKNFDQAIAQIGASKDIAREQAEVLAAALSKAKIDIVGGEGEFFNSFAKALSVGKAIEGVAGKSPFVHELLGKLVGKLDGDAGGKRKVASGADE
ncbi:MAG TPA: hypothetical protein VFY12_08305, partial [Arenimonas sp.]|nr:hypothetical protein [Arenimonas sp.]